jgi:uncharacterized protein
MNQDNSHSSFQPLSWAERNGFAHWAVAVLWLIIVLILFQVVASLVFIGLMFITGDLTSGQDIADILSDRVDLLFIGNTTGQILFIGLATFLIVRLHTTTERKRSFLRLRWNQDSLKYILYGTLLVLTVQPIVVYLGHLNSLLPIPESLTDLQVSQYQMIQDFLTTDGILLFGLLHIALVPAICEEVLFRGYILRAFEKSWGIVTGIIVSGIIFGLFHIQLGNILPLASLGIILALMTWLSGTIWPAVVAHLINNGAAVVVGIHFPELLFREDIADVLPPLWLLFASIFLTVIIIYTMIKQSDYTDQN